MDYAPKVAGTLQPYGRNDLPLYAALHGYERIVGFGELALIAPPAAPSVPAAPPPGWCPTSSYRSRSGCKLRIHSAIGVDVRAHHWLRERAWSSAMKLGDGAIIQAISESGRRAAVEREAHGYRASTIRLHDGLITPPRPREHTAKFGRWGTALHTRHRQVLRSNLAI